MRYIKKRYEHLQQQNFFKSEEKLENKELEFNRTLIEKMDKEWVRSAMTGEKLCIKKRDDVPYMKKIHLLREKLRKLKMMEKQENTKRDMKKVMEEEWETAIGLLYPDQKNN